MPVLNSNNSIEKTYKNSLELASSHYENFPVVSLLIPKNLRKHIAVIYRFARTADDFADEGIMDERSRLQLLNNYENDFTSALSEDFKNDFWKSLFLTIKKFNLTPQYLFDLLSAFKQDVVKKRYKDFNELNDYCKRSANPVGRLILELFGIKNSDIIKYSDDICTALQLTNFYQDLAIDYKINRIYIPEEEMAEYGVSEKIFESGLGDANLRKLLSYQIGRTRELFDNGRRILPKLPANLRRQIRWTIFGGEEILKKIVQIDYNVLINRPKLSKIDYIRLLFKSLRD